MADIKKIREAVLKNRGGFETASDSEILTIWNSLTDETRKQYIESVKTVETAKKSPQFPAETKRGD